MIECWFCGAAGAAHEMSEVWFDFGEPVMRFCSTDSLYARDAPRPRMCGAHKKEEAHALAEAILLDAVKVGATGPLWPARWWARYADGDVIGGDVRPRGSA